MRTRRSNRTQRYNYDDEGLSADELPGQHASRRRQTRTDKDDANFDGSQARESPVEAVAGDADSSDASVAITGTPDDSSDAPASGADDGSPRARARARPRRRRNPPKGYRIQSHVGGYLDIEPFVTDTHFPRGYAGSFERHLRRAALANAWYGPRQADVDMALELLERWLSWPLLPPREPVPAPGTVLQGIWDPSIPEREAEYVGRWRALLRAARPEGTVVTPLSEEESWPYRPSPGPLSVLMGPHDSQSRFILNPGDAHTLSTKGVPVDQTSEGPPSGWILDSGGIVLSLDWEPQDVPSTSPQRLALAVTPHADQRNYNYEEESAKHDFQKSGTVQIWDFHRTVDKTYARPALQSPRLHKTLCFDSGRARRVKWAPGGVHLAVLTHNQVDIVEPLSGGDATYIRIERPVSSLALDDGIRPTTMAWVAVNRLAVGYADGTVALWSIHPRRLLSRHPAHHSTIIDMTSGYPSLPYLVATVPVGGYVKLMDLSNPSCETTEIPTLAIRTTPNLLSWSDHLRGFFTLFPSSNIFNTAIAFLHHSSFPIPRRTLATDTFVTCLAVGRTHPFLLVGSDDGSLFAVNPQIEVFQMVHPRHGITHRICLFQHEHRPPVEGGPSSSLRGSARVLHGFKPEPNRRSKTDNNRGRKGQGLKKDKEDEGIADDSDGAPSGLDPTKLVIHEPLTRVTAVEWNPNNGYGCWAAAALASGLVKIMDLGLDGAEGGGQG